MYRIAFKKDSTTWYGLDANKQLKLLADPYYMDNDVENWSSYGMKDQRNMRMEGFFRSYFESAYQFINDAKIIIWQVLTKYGSQTPIRLYVENNKVFDYEVALNLGTAREGVTSNQVITVDVEIMEDDIPALVKSREDVTYEIPIWNDANARIANILPFRVRGIMRYLSGWPTRAAGSTTTSFRTSASLIKISSLYVNKTIVEVSDTPANQPASYPDPSANNYVTGQDYEALTGGGNYANANNYLLKANVDLKNVVVKVQLPFFVQNHTGTNSTFRLSVSKMNSSGIPTQIFSVQSAVINGGTSLNFTISIDNTNNPITLLTGERLILECGMSTVAAQDINIAWEKDRYVDVSFEHYTNSFDVTGLPWWYVGQKLIEKITDGKGAFASNLLTVNSTYADGIDLRMKDVIMLSGDSIRGVDKAVLKISLKHYLAATNSFCCAGLGVEGTTIRIERKDYFYKSSAANLIADLGIISSAEIGYAADTLYNEVHVGNKVQDYDDINGKDEFNTTSKYLTPVTSDKNVLDLVSPVRTDGYGIFYTWVQYAFQKNKDSSSDNDLFALQIKPNPYTWVNLIPKHGALYPSDISSTYSVTGSLESDRVLNIGLTPRKCLERHGYDIRSMMYGMDNQKLIFQTSDRNQNLQSRISGVKLFKENEDVLISSLGPVLYYPFYLNPNVQSPTNYKLLFDANRYGFFRYTYEGKTHEGYVITSESENAKPKLHKYKLLATNNDNPSSWA